MIVGCRQECSRSRSQVETWSGLSGSVNSNYQAEIIGRKPPYRGDIEPSLAADGMKPSSHEAV